MIANQNGIAAAGDSLLTLQPQRLNLHLNGTQKVYSDPDQGLIWACCGLMVYAGVHYGRLVSRILRQKHRSMPSRMNQITQILKLATGVQSRFTRGSSVFTLILGSVRDGKPTIQVLDVVDGKAAFRTCPAPTVVQSGWDPDLHQPKPAVEEFETETLDQLATRVKDRCLWAIQRDTHLAAEERAHIQTVGGNVRVAVLPVK